MANLRLSVLKADLQSGCRSLARWQLPLARLKKIYFHVCAAAYLRATVEERKFPATTHLLGDSRTSGSAETPAKRPAVLLTWDAEGDEKAADGARSAPQDVFANAGKGACQQNKNGRNAQHIRERTAQGAAQSQARPTYLSDMNCSRTEAVVLNFQLKLLMTSGTAFARTANKTIIKQVAIVLHILLELGRNETAQGCYVATGNATLCDCT